MSTRDFFKNSVLEAFGQVDPAKIGLSLLVALAMGILIYYVYKRFFTGVVYSRSFAVTLVGMCVLTCMVTLAISTNVVISLGMVGALSIVRYRTAVKDPLDLLYLFWAITTGITAGAGMYALVGLTAVVIVADDRRLCEPPGQVARVHDGHPLHGPDHRRRYRACIWAHQVYGEVQDHAR